MPDLDECQMISVADAKKLVQEAIEEFETNLADNLYIEIKEDYWKNEVELQLVYKDNPLGWPKSFSKEYNHDHEDKND